MAQRNIFTLLTTEEEKAAAARATNIDAPKVSTQEPPPPSLAKRIQSFLKEQNFNAVAELIMQAPERDRSSLMWRAACALGTDTQLEQFFGSCSQALSPPQFAALLLASSNQMLAEADAMVLSNYLVYIPPFMSEEIQRRACGLKRERFDLFVRVILLDRYADFDLSAMLRKEIYSRYGSADAFLRKHYTPDGETLFSRICATSAFGFVRVRVWNEAVHGT